MNQSLTTTYNTRNAAWGNKTLCGHFIVHDIGSADSFNYPAIYILLFCTSLTEKRREKCRVWGFHSEKPD